MSLREVHTMAVDTVEALLTTHGARLHDLIGRRIVESWVAWERERDAFVGDEWIVLTIDGQPLSIRCHHLDRISLAWDASVLARAAEVGSDAHPRPIEWRRDAHPALVAATGQRITRITAIEYRLEFRRLDGPAPADERDERHAAWMLNGLEFTVDDGVLVIYNALDETGISNLPFSGPQIRRTVL